MYGTSFPSAVTIQMYCSAVNIIKDAIIKNARAVRSRIRDCPRERFIRIHNASTAEELAESKERCGRWL
jgi:hypothetical protein